MRRFLIVLVLLGLLSLIVQGSLYPIPDGHVGVVTPRLSGVRMAALGTRILPPGVHLDLPYVMNCQLYNTRVQMMYLEVLLGAETAFQLTAQVRLSSDSAALIHQKFGPKYLDEAFRPTLTALMKDEIYKSAAAKSQLDETRLRDAIGRMLSKNGIILDEMIFTRAVMMEPAPEPEEESDTDENQN